MDVVEVGGVGHPAWDNNGVVEEDNHGVVDEGHGGNLGGDGDDDDDDQKPNKRRSLCTGSIDIILKKQCRDQCRDH